MEDAERFEALGARVDDRLDELSVDRYWLAEEIRVPYPSLNKMLSGETLGKTVDMASRLNAIEAVLEFKHGSLLRDMGFVAEPVTAREHLEGDPRLQTSDRETLLFLYDHFVERAATVRARASEQRRQRKAARSGQARRVRGGAAKKVAKRARELLPDESEEARDNRPPT